MIADLGQGNGYRVRVACLMAIQALIESKIQRSSFEVVLLHRLIELGSDSVLDVRIALARTVALMCQHDELYALPQSRSPELLGLIKRLTKDRCADVSNPILAILPKEEGEVLGIFDSEGRLVQRSPPFFPVRTERMELGPADGGPHKRPKSPEIEKAPSENGLNEPFLMDGDGEDEDMEDVNMNDIEDDGNWIDPDSSMREDDDEEDEIEQSKIQVPSTSKDSSSQQTEEDDSPSNSNITNSQVSDSTPAVQFSANATLSRNKALGLLSSLSSPDKSQLVKNGKGTSTAQGSEDATSPNSGAARVPSDPFLNFVVERANADGAVDQNGLQALLSPGPTESSTDGFAKRFSASLNPTTPPSGSKESSTTQTPQL